MISHLKGKVIHNDLKYVVLDVSGVGYKVYTNAGSLGNPLGKELEFWTYLAVRENALDLFGFQKKEELDFFELLLSVSGIGLTSRFRVVFS